LDENVYRRLAEQLDRTPNGFPMTESGVELRLLAKMFTPEEALLASVMDLVPETVTPIAERAGVARDAAAAILARMAAKGLVGSARDGEAASFALRPFIVGSYESQLPRMDEEFATLTEQYFQETKGGISRDLPHLHRVLPVEKAIPFELEIFPYERAAELLEGAKSWGVRSCICRVQQRLVGKGCGHPVESCLVFAPVEGAFDGDGVDRMITKGEALQILREAAESGLIHSTANYRSGHSYICSCCTCCCGVLRSVADLGVSRTVARSGFHAVVDVDVCIGCGDCVARCQFGGLSVSDDSCHVELARCAGCGQCTMACSVGALNLVRLPDSDAVKPPADVQEWRAQRTESRERARAAPGALPPPRLKRGC
jgi:Pyruvate/2-oxoacid:ferredoxin oxidoreductase delta subunit